MSDKNRINLLKAQYNKSLFENVKNIQQINDINIEIIKKTNDIIEIELIKGSNVDSMCEFMQSIENARQEIIMNNVKINSYLGEIRIYENTKD